MRLQVKSCRPHLMPACCMAASRASRSGGVGPQAVLMPKGESGSSASASRCGGSFTSKRFSAVGGSAANASCVSVSSAATSGADFLGR